ncbi:RloB family protein [Bacillus sp. UNC438CL73TsuS30]|uniref:RloB family protein n=1 Tax=Bacillus sp. UNC438CL73TsuS30 TaxID=1340434 RepID=UPI000479EEE1|nr:RloB family protein [Bacillus sp. UNC438CL73TsuS30]
MGTDNLFHKRRERKINSRKIAPDRFLIVCEGEKTEPNYFRYFKNKINEIKKDTVNIQIEGTGKNTISLVDHTIRLMNRAIPDYTQVWCVFDRDSFPTGNFDIAIEKATKAGIQVAYSNEAFELWYLLHFHYYDSAFNREQYIEILNSIFNQKLDIPYEKNIEGIYEIINSIGNEDFAIKNAKKVNAMNQHLNPENANPSTKVYALVEELTKFIN